MKSTNTAIAATSFVPPKKEDTITLDEKEALRREMILSGNMVKTIFLIALPLVFYNSLNQIFQLIDTLIAANMSAGVVSTVSFISQIETMLFAVGTGLSVGGSIIIARSYGEGDLEKVAGQIARFFSQESQSALSYLPSQFRSHIRSSDFSECPRT